MLQSIQRSFCRSLEAGLRANWPVFCAAEASQTLVRGISGSSWIMDKSDDSKIEEGDSVGEGNKWKQPRGRRSRENPVGKGDRRPRDKSRQMTGPKKVVPMSEQLRELYEAVQKKDKSAIAKYQLQKDELSDEDLLLLADAVEFYFSMAPHPAPNVDGLRPSDRSALFAMAKLIRAYKGSKPRDDAVPKGWPVHNPLEQTTINATPPGRLPWELIGVHEEAGTLFWGVDLTDGKAKQPWKNARLSQAAKNTMYEAYKTDPEKYSPEKLADIFKIRVQRVLAIIRLKAEEEKEGENLSPFSKEFAGKMEAVLKCTETIGSGEKHYVTLPSYPAYVDVKEEDVIAGLETVLGKKAEEMQPEDITKDIALKAIGVKSIEDSEDAVAAKEEKHLVEEFKMRLDYNLGIIGKSLSRKSRRRSAPVRPKEGWSLVVNPVGKETKQKHQIYVAMPDGSQRELNEDEKLHVERKTPRPRRKII